VFLGLGLTSQTATFEHGFSDNTWTSKVLVNKQCWTGNSESRVTLSRELGNLIYDYCNVQPSQTRHCLQLAQRVHLSTGSHEHAMVCMVRLGNVETALEYAEQQQCSGTQLAQVRTFHCTRKSSNNYYDFITIILPDHLSGHWSMDDATVCFLSDLKLGYVVSDSTSLRGSISG